MRVNELWSPVTEMQICSKDMEEEEKATRLCDEASGEIWADASPQESLQQWFPISPSGPSLLLCLITASCSVFVSQLFILDYKLLSTRIFSFLITGNSYAHCAHQWYLMLSSFSLFFPRSEGSGQRNGVTVAQGFIGEEKGELPFSSFTVPCLKESRKHTIAKKF